MAKITLPRASSPAAAGISSKALASFIAEINANELDIHSVMVVRRGQVAYEDFRAPYRPEDPHILFSVSKSITAIAVGFAVDEGCVSLNDKVADLLPELRMYDSHKYLERLKVYHLVTMTAGKKISVTVDRSQKQWVRDYAMGEWSYAPGENFSYCNENIYLLCAIICRVTGQSVTDFLTPRLYEPLGIERPYWEHDGCGVEVGGWGLNLRTEDIAKIAMCYLDEGKFQGSQVIPAHWVRDSSAKQEETKRDGGTPTGHGDYGYGYCFWRNVIPNSFRMDGMFAQFAWIFPEYDACVVTTGGEMNMGKIQDIFYAHALSLFDESNLEAADIPKLPEYPALAATPRNPAIEAKLNGRCIHFPDNIQKLSRAVKFPPSMMPVFTFFMSHDKAGGIDNLHFNFQEDSVKFSWSEGRERNTVLCGMDGRARKCKIKLGGVEFVLSCSAAWEGDELHMRLRCVNSVAVRKLTFWFGDNRIVRMLPRSEPALEGLVEGAANGARENINNKFIGELAARLMGAIVLIAEPLHVGYMRK